MRKILSIIIVACVLLGAFGLSSCKKLQKHRGRYEINAEYRDDARAISGTVKVTFYNSYEMEVNKIKFNLYPNAYRKNALYPAVGEGERASAYYDGESYGEITVTSVNGGKNWSIEGADENILSVALIQPLSKGEEITLDISFVTELAKVEHRLGVGRRAVNLAYFYPRLCAYRDGEFLEDESAEFGLPFRSDIATYKVTLTMPAGYSVIGGGTVEQTKGLESKTKYTFELENARDFACVIAKELTVNRLHTKLSNGKELEIAYGSLEGANEPRILETLQKIVEYYSRVFGAYPYSTLSVVSTGSSIQSSAHTTTVFLSETLSETEQVNVVAREIARQWWGKCVGSDDVNEAWQSESLSEYSAIAFFEAHKEYGMDRNALMKKCLEEYRGYFSVYGSVFGGVDTRMTKSLKEYASAHEYKCIARDRGVVMLDTLRKSVGEKNFFKALSYYYAKNAYSNVKPIAMYEAFEKCGVSAEGFFESFLTGKSVI